MMKTLFKFVALLLLFVSILIRWSESSAFAQTSAVQLVAGANFSCVLFDNGAVKCWGANNFGQLGLQDNVDRGRAAGSMGAQLPFVSVASSKKVVKLSTSSQANHVCALLETGEIKCWGSNGQGQLGLGDNASRGATANSMGDSLPVVNLGANLMAADVAVGGRHSCALLRNGSVKCWGANDVGQLGLGNNVNMGDQANKMGDQLPFVNLGTGLKATSIAAGNNNTCAILDDGSLKCWGLNTAGQSGQPITTQTVGTSPTHMGDALLPIYLSESASAAKVTIGLDFICAILTDSSLKCWGLNGAGQLGQGDNVPRGRSASEFGDNLFAISLTPGLATLNTSCGGSFCCAVSANRAVKCWGNNLSGQLGIGSTNAVGNLPNQMGNNLSFAALGPLYSASSVAAGAAHSCALMANGTVKCWGRNNEGEAGIESAASTIGTIPSELGNNLTSVKLLQ